MNLSYEIIDAVDGRKGLPVQYENMVDTSAMLRDFGRPMSNPEIGCALSHISVYKKMIQRDLPGALILEDDTVWSTAATKLLRELKPGELDFLQLDYGWADIWRFSPPKPSGKAGVKFKRLAKNSGLANSYIISNFAAKYLLENSLPVTSPADWPCDLRELKPMITFPRVCHQSRSTQGDSYLQSGRRNLKKHRKAAGPPSLDASFLSNRNGKRNPSPKMPYFIYRLLIRRVAPEKSPEASKTS